MREWSGLMAGSLVFVVKSSLRRAYPGLISVGESYPGAVRHGGLKGEGPSDGDEYLQDEALLG